MTICQVGISPTHLFAEATPPTPSIGHSVDSSWLVGQQSVSWCWSVSCWSMVGWSAVYCSGYHLCCCSPVPFSFLIENLEPWTGLRSGSGSEPVRTTKPAIFISKNHKNIKWHRKLYGPDDKHSSILVALWRFLAREPCGRQLLWCCCWKMKMLTQMA